jgi:hypothetical protein
VVQECIQENLKALEHIRKKAKLWQCAHIKRIKVGKELTFQLGEPKPTNCDVGIKEVSKISFKIVTWLLKELFACQGTNSSHLAILEKVIGHEFIIPLLPRHYPNPHEAKV